MKKSSSRSNLRNNSRSIARAPFSNIIGTTYPIPNSISLTNGYTIPASTRVFIHAVRYLSSGEEAVTIVFPMTSGSICIIGYTEVTASSLSSGAGDVHTAH